MISMNKKQLKQLQLASKTLKEIQSAVMAEYLDNYGNGETKTDNEIQQYLIQQHLSLLQDTINNLREIIPPWEEA